MLYSVYGLHEEGKPDEIRYIGCTSQLPEKLLAGHKTARNGLLPVNQWVASVMAAGKHIACRVLLQTERIEELRSVSVRYAISCFAGKAFADTAEAKSIRSVKAKIAAGSRTR